MATKSKSNSNKYGNKIKSYLPHNKAVNKGAYPLRPGVEGFFITCDVGREHQASQEAIDVIDSFFEELLEEKEFKSEQAELPKKPANKIIKFDSSGSEGDDDGTNGGESLQKQEPEELEKPEVGASNLRNVPKKVEEKSVDKLIEAELAELGDKSKHEVDAGVLKKVMLAEGAVVTVKGARSVSLRHPVELPLPLNRTSNNFASGLLTLAEYLRDAARSHNDDALLLSLRIVGPTSLTSPSSPSDNRLRLRLRLKRLAPGLVELSSASKKPHSGSISAVDLKKHSTLIKTNIQYTRLRAK